MEIDFRGIRTREAATDLRKPVFPNDTTLGHGEEHSSNALSVTRYKKDPSIVLNTDVVVEKLLCASAHKNAAMQGHGLDESQGLVKSTPKCLRTLAAVISGEC